MLDSKQLKTLGLRFARALQTTVKTAGVFTIEHKSADRPVQQSFLLLNNLLRETGQFTFGFVDNQVLLNNLLTTEPTLRQLETEFLKRGVSAITFEPGLTLARYKKIIQILSVATAVMEAAGGVLAFLDQNEVEGVRILPAARNQKKNADGDTILETDSETYILSKQIGDAQAPRDFLDSIDALLESGCFDPSTRTEVLSNFAAQGVEGSYGVPVEVPRLVTLKEGETVVAAGQALPGGGGNDRALSASAGQGAPMQTMGGPGAGHTGGAGTSSWASESFAGGSFGHTGYSTPATMGGGGTTAVGGVPGRGGGIANPGPSTFLELVESSVQRSLLEEKGNPEKSYSSLARILRNTGVDKILERFPAARREELSTLPPEQLAAEYIQETALQIAGTKLRSAPGESQKLVVEEEVVHVLARSLQATHAADRLAQKLTQFIQDFAVPAHIQERIREEMQWTALNGTKKYARLMELQHYSNIEFRRLLDFAKELVNQRDMERATALVSHYFDFLDVAEGRIETTELSRAPELIRTIPVAQVSFASKTAERLGRTLLREDLSEFIHFQAASALTVLAQSIAAFEDFQNVYAIAGWLEKSNHRDAEKHKKCCGTGLARLLPASAVERIIELYLQQRGDSAWSKTAATLLRFAAPASIESVFHHLIDEQDTKNRLALLRLASHLGAGSIEIARKYLEDERWYVVRNVCGVLAELKDPKLVEHIAPALQHPDARVQQTALKAIVKSRAAGAGSVLAASLSRLAPNLQDEALDELMFLKNAGCIPSLEEFVRTRRGNASSSRKAVQTLGSIQDEAALHALARLYRTEELDPGIRRATLAAIANHPSPLVTKLLEELAASWGPLTDEVRAALERRKTR
ncbi:MAG TPA: HEAT repeat domain-containing protein [Terriglobales bacterium]|nr:HEAT repeat domain-containing protein [Terriglobales bacterium]